MKQNKKFAQKIEDELNILPCLNVILYVNDYKYVVRVWIYF